MVSRTSPAAQAGANALTKPASSRFKLQKGIAAFSLLDSALQLHSSLVDPVFLNDLAVMKHVELLSGVLASKHHDGLLPARVLT